MSRPIRSQSRVNQRFLLLLTVASAACGDGITGPGEDVGRIGPFPAMVTGAFAFTSCRWPPVETGAPNECDVHLIDVATRTDRVIASFSEQWIESVSWSPDGDSLAIQLLDTHNSPSEWFRLTKWLRPDGSTRALPLAPSGYGYHLSVGPGGELAYFGAGGLYVDGVRLVEEGLITSNSYVAWSPDGRALFTTEQSSGAWRHDLDARVSTQLSPPPEGDIIVEPAVSPDGSRVAFQRYGGASGNGSIWILPSAGGTWQRLTSGAADLAPSWTPSGSHVAFARFLGGRGGIFLVPAEGGSPIRVVQTDNLPSKVAWRP